MPRGDRSGLHARRSAATSVADRTDRRRLAVRTSFAPWDGVLAGDIWIWWSGSFRSRPRWRSWPARARTLTLSLSVLATAALVLELLPTSITASPA